MRWFTGFPSLVISLGKETQSPPPLKQKDNPGYVTHKSLNITNFRGFLFWTSFGGFFPLLCREEPGGVCSTGSSSTTACSGTCCQGWCFAPFLWFITVLTIDVWFLQREQYHQQWWLLTASSKRTVSVTHCTKGKIIIIIYHFFIRDGSLLTTCVFSL